MDLVCWYINITHFKFWVFQKNKVFDIKGIKMVNHPIISDESEIIAGLCFCIFVALNLLVNYKEVNRIYKLFNLIKKEYIVYFIF